MDPRGDGALTRACSRGPQGSESGTGTVISVSPRADWGESQGLVRLTKKETSNERETDRERVCLLITKSVLAQILPKELKIQTLRSPRRVRREGGLSPTGRFQGRKDVGTPENLGQPFRRALNVLFTELY